MITPRRTRLLRVPNEQAFRRAVRLLIVGGDSAARLIIVPTCGAAVQLRRVLESGERPDSGLSASLVTRDQLYAQLHRRLPLAPRVLTGFERDAMAQAAAAAAMAVDLPFQIRPGLVVEILRFYDHLRRQSQQVNRFEELIEQALGGSITVGDRGAERMIEQTRFLASTFREYERRVLACGACDEHMLRDRLLVQDCDPLVRHVVVTVPDWIADPSGLFVADFELLSQLPLLQAIDIVSTEAVLGSGFHEQLHRWLPELEELAGEEVGGAIARAQPTIVMPSPPAPSDQYWFIERDRAQELAAVVRHLVGGGLDRQGNGSTDDSRLDRMAVVFKQPLPYLYLAPETFGGAGISYQASDGLPLAAEPTVAAVDLALTAVETGFTRDAIVAILRLPHFRFLEGGEPIPREAIKALDQELSALRYLGGLGRLEELATGWGATEAWPALQAALRGSRDLAPLGDRAPASQQIHRLLAFLAAYATPIDQSGVCGARERRARAAIEEILIQLAAAHAVHHDALWRIEDLAGTLRRWIQRETFVWDTPGASGVHLLDDQAARYGEFDEITIVGLVENEWPEQPRRNIFFSSGLLKALGWPSEKDRRAAADSRFLDLLASPTGCVRLSTFATDEDEPVTRSVQLDLVSRAKLPATVAHVAPAAPVFLDELLACADVDLQELEGPTRQWAALRTSRPAGEAPEFHGSIGPQLPRSRSVSALETYVGCPFKFFAQQVLALAEEPDDEEVMGPRLQGRFVHEVFEVFFATWRKAGRRAIVPGNLNDARAMFAAVVERKLKPLPDGEAGLERTRLLGSSAAAGLGEAVLRMEAERPVDVIDRLLEYELKGPFTIATALGARQVELHGKADRLDLLGDGTFRLIDYKLGWPPNRRRALQLPIYGLCAEQQLARDRGTRWTLGEAVYLAFKGPRRVVPLFSSPSDREAVLADAQQRLADALDAIGRGQFPPAPDDVHRCDSCSFAAVCRKDYVSA